MEGTTSPNITGFSRKPRNRKRINGRMSATRKSGFNPLADMPHEAKVWMLGSMFLIAAARMLGPVIGFEIPETRNADATAD